MSREGEPPGEPRLGGSLALPQNRRPRPIMQAVFDRQARQGMSVAGAPPSVPDVLLYHSPELMPQAVQMGIDLYLCGHTHGGQVRMPIIGPLLTSSNLGRDYVMGHYEEEQTDLYVSTGVGLEGLSAPRVRLLAPPEITLVTLRHG